MKQNKNCKTSRWHVRQTSKAEKVSYKNIKRVSSMQSIYLSQCFSLSLFISSFFWTFFFQALFHRMFFFSFLFCSLRCKYTLQKIPLCFTKTATEPTKISLREQAKIWRADGWNFCMLYIKNNMYDNLWSLHFLWNFNIA